MYSANFIAKIKRSVEMQKDGITKQAFLGFLLGVFLVSAVFGQNSNYSKNTADQSLRSSGRVNPATLGMEMDVPLGAYPGRGINLPLGLSYSSKLWRFQENRTEYLNNGNQNNYVYAKYSEDSASGWTSSLSQAYIEYTGEFYRFDAYGRPLQEVFGPGGQSPPGDYYIKRVMVHLPGGGSQELRAQDAPIYIAYGQIPPPSAWEGSFYATDGSGLKYVQDTTANPAIYRLFMPDGSFYDFNATRESKNSVEGVQVRRANRLTDINSNFVQFNAPTTNYPNGFWTDQLGRTFPVMIPRETPAIPVNQTILEQTFTLPGMSQGYILRWKKLKGNTAGESAFTDFYNQELAQYAIGANRLFTSWIRTDTCSFNYVNVESTQATQYFNPIVLTEIVLPNGASYRFSYNKYGEIERIFYPTGGREEINYTEVASLAEMSPPYQQTNRGVTNRKIYESNSDSTADIWTYSAASSPNNFRTGTLAPDGTQTDRFMHRGVWSGCGQQNPEQSAQNYYGTHWGYDNILAGMAYEERMFSSDGQLKQRTLTRWTATNTATELTLLPQRYVQRNARVLSTESIVYEGDAGLSTSVSMEYDTDVDNFGSPQNVVRTKQYGYKVVSRDTSITPNQTPPTEVVVVPDPTVGATLLKIADTSYLQSDVSYNQTEYLARNLVKLVIGTKVRKPNEDTVAQTEIKYDEPNYRGGEYRGQPTTIRNWLDTNDTWIQVRSKFDGYGNVIEITNANNKITTTEYSAEYFYAYPTRVTTPAPDTSGLQGSTVGLQTTTAYNLTTGLPTSVTDANGLETRMEYVDALLRPTKVKNYYNNQPVGAETITEYGIPNSSGQLTETQRFVKVKTQIDAGNWKQAYTWFDGLGRTIKSQTVDSNGDIFVETEYDNMSRATRATNPYRTGDTKLWTEMTFDTSGRVWKVTMPDGAFVETIYGLATTGSQIGTTVTVKDQALKERRSITNALGQLTRVDEPNDINQLGAINAPNQPTNYSYDIMDNLTQVQQIGTTTQQCGGTSSYCIQTRTFVYDSLMRLKQAVNPEAGTIQYSYDNNGNLTQKIDARSIQTNYVYDNINRIKTRSYANEPAGQTATSTVNYYYDNLINAKGKLIEVENIISKTKYLSFDGMGRVTSSQQITDGTTYNPMSYVYNLSGALIEETYPSGRVVKNTLDQDGDLQQVQSRKANDTFRNYANAFNYTAAGAVSSVRLGNGRWENTVFNSRLQPTQIGLGTSATNQSLLKLNYDYGTTDNNGNVKSQTITVQRSNQSPLLLTQSYVYDSLNRLQSAEEKDTGNVTTWKQTYTFDRYGNRRFDQANTTFPTSFSNPNITNPQIDPSNNRFPTGQGYTYDLAGNLLTDAEGRTFNYDAENKQKTAANTGGTIGQYFYDGDGKRVKKIGIMNGQAEETIFVYDAFGKLVAEYSTQLSQTPQTQYQTTDHLGTPRINTNELGAVVSRSDYLPYGEEIVGFGNRSSTDKYVSDDVRQGFTGYIKDDETGLDFAEARMYKKQLGRFNSVDPIIMKKERLSDPQAIALYVYTRNNPLRFIDPNGKEYVGADGKRVEYEKKNGKIVVKKGKETKDLQKLVAAINKSGSKTAIKRFMDLNKNQTKVTIKLTDDKNFEERGQHFVQDKNGNLLDVDKAEDRAKAAFTPDGKEYAAATIVFREDLIYSQSDINRERQVTPSATGDDVLTLTFVHESVHDTDPNQIGAVFASQKPENKNKPFDTSVFHPDPVKVDGKSVYPKGSTRYFVNMVRDEINESRKRE